MSSLASQYDVGKVKLKPKRHHGYNVLLFILGTLFPPLAVAARFGIGSDFFLNLILTIAGYIPGHVHNFYIQNIRNNKNHKRTPKWAQRYGLVDTSTIKRHEKRSQWASRFNERNPHSTLEDAQLEEGQMPGGSSSSLPTTPNPIRPQGTGLWNPEDEQYYNASDSGSLQSGSRWRYPANFDDAMPAPAAESSSSSRKKKVKKDRHARTEDAYSMPVEEGRRRKKKKRSSRRESAGGEYAPSTHSLPSAEGPEDPEGAYGRSNGTGAAGAATGGARTDDDIFRHEF